MDANQADSNVSMLKKALAEINHQYRGLLSKAADEEKAELAHELYSNLAYISGALAFLQIQNSGADSAARQGEAKPRWSSPQKGCLSAPLRDCA